MIVTPTSRQIYEAHIDRCPVCAGAPEMCPRATALWGALSDADHLDLFTLELARQARENHVAFTLDTDTWTPAWLDPGQAARCLMRGESLLVEVDPSAAIEYRLNWYLGQHLAAAQLGARFMHRDQVVTPEHAAELRAARWCRVRTMTPTDAMGGLTEPGFVVQQHSPAGVVQIYTPDDDWPDPEA